jgi:hypothetical protein
MRFHVLMAMREQKRRSGVSGAQWVLQANEAAMWGK